MLLISWLKWKLKIRFKDKYSKYKFFKWTLHGNIFYTVKIIMSIVRMFLLYMSVLFFSKILINNQKEVICLLSLYFLISTVWSGLIASNWFLGSKDKYWLFANVIRNEFILKGFIYCESILWSFKTNVKLHLPILLALTYIYNTKIVNFSILVLMYILMYLLIALTSSYIHTTYNKLRNVASNIKLLYITIIVKRIMYLGIFYYVGNYFSSLFIKLPIFQKEQTNKLVNDWNNELSIINNKLKIFFEKIIIVINEKNLMYQLITNDFEYNKIIVPLIMFLVLIITVIGVIIKIDRLIDMGTLKNGKIKLYFIENMIFILIGWFKIKSETYYKTYIKVVLRSEVFKRKLDVAYGGIFYWGSIGIASSILKVSSGHDKLYYLVISMVIFVPVYFFIKTLFESLTSVLSIESEKNNIQIQFLAKKTVWDIFKTKFFVTIVVVLPTIIIGDLFLCVLGEINILDALLIIFLHMILSILIIIVNHLPTIINQHFEYDNEEMLSDYADKELTKMVIDFIMFTFVNFLIVSPILLFIEFNISRTMYLIMQFIIIDILLLAIVLIVLKFLKIKLQKIATLDMLNI